MAWSMTCKAGYLGIESVGKSQKRLEDSDKGDQDRAWAVNYLTLLNCSTPNLCCYDRELFCYRTILSNNFQNEIYASSVFI